MKAKTKSNETGSSNCSVTAASGPASADRESILTAAEAAVPLQVVTADEWSRNGRLEVFVRTLRAKDLDVVQAIITERSNGKITEAVSMARWCILGVCDDQGIPLFRTEDVDRLLAGPLAPLQRCMLALFDLNRIGTTHANTDDQEKKTSGRQSRERSIGSP